MRDAFKKWHGGSFFNPLVALVAIILVVIILTAPISKAALPLEVEWINQFGVSSGFSLTYSQDVDITGNVYVGGGTTDALPGQTGNGAIDAFVRKYDVNGIEQWTRQFGTSGDEDVVDIAVDSSSVYVVGSTTGALPSQTTSGGYDAFIRKYDVNGNELWTRQFGTSGNDIGSAIGILSSEVYVTGRTDGTFSGQTSSGNDDIFVLKYDSSGNVVWTRQLGTAGFDEVVGLEADSSGIYLAGGTDGAFSGYTNQGDFDAFVRKYDTSGNEVWTRQFGTSSYDDAFEVSIFGSAVYAVGMTSGTLPSQVSAGGDDAFIRKYDVSGNELWTRQFGTSQSDSAFGISAVVTGVYITGGTDGTMPGQTSAGGSDIFLRKYDASGAAIWTVQFGTASSDAVFGSAISGSNLYVTGSTLDVLPDQTKSGYQDAFVAKFKEDVDGDGILNDVDDSLIVFSDNFGDGTSNGIVNTRGDQIVRVEDHSDQALGLLVSAVTDGSGTRVAKIQSCGSSTKVSLGSGSSMVVTCGSATIEALAGTIIVEFLADDGTISSTSMDAGNTITFYPDTEIFIAASNNIDPVVIEVNGEEVMLNPGVTAIASIDTLINPEGQSSVINPGSNRALRVAMLSSSEFDATQIDPNTVTIGPDKKPAKSNLQEDINGDGLIDMVFNFNVRDAGIKCGDSEVVVRGETVGGSVVLGSGAIRTAGCQQLSVDNSPYYARFLPASWLKKSKFDRSWRTKN